MWGFLRNRRTSPRAPIAVAVIALAAAALALVPLWYLTSQVLGAGTDRVSEILRQSHIVALAARSLGLACGVAIAAGVLGSITAWLCESTDLFASRWWNAAIVAPIAVPSYVAAYAWVSLDGRYRSFLGAAIVLTGATVPLVHLHVAAAMRRLDPALEEAAASLGWSPTKVTFRLLIPQLRRATASGMLLAALYVMADFGAVATMRIPVFTWTIHGAYKAGFEPDRAAVLSAVLCLLALLLVGAEAAVRGRREPAKVGSGAMRERPRVRLGRWAPAAHLGLVAWVMLTLGFPVIRSVQWMTEGGSRVELGEFVSALVTTLVLGAVVGLATVVFGVPLGYLVARHRSTLSLTAERSVLTLHSLPGIVVAISFVYIGTRLLIGIYQKWPIVVLGLAGLLMSFVVTAARTAFEQQPTSLMRAAQSAGCSETKALLRVGLPLAWPAVAVSFATVILHAAKELPMTLLLRPSGADTLATRLWGYSTTSASASVAPFALALIVLSVPPTMLMALRTDRRR